MIPAEIILSSKTYHDMIKEPNIQREINTGKEPLSALESHFATPIAIQEDNTDVLIAKELFPNPCPVCGRRIPFLREMIERLESSATDNKVNCPLGHRYEGTIKIYYLNIFQTPSPETKTVQNCPQCGSRNIQYLSQTDIFCLDCEWDNLKRI